MSSHDTMKLPSVAKDMSTINPFKTIVDDLGIDTWRKVTIEYLNWIHQLMKPHSIPLETYGDTFKVLEFMAESGAIELKTEDDYHLIKRGQYLGKN